MFSTEHFHDSFDPKTGICLFEFREFFGDGRRQPVLSGTGLPVLQTRLVRTKRISERPLNAKPSRFVSAIWLAGF